MRQERPDVQMCLAAPPVICKELQDAVTMCRPVNLGQSPFAVTKWYEIDLAQAAFQCRADVVFSLTNYLPNRRLTFPTLLLEQHAGHFSPIFDRLTCEAAPSTIGRLAWRYRCGWVRRSVEAATVLTVQTAALADAIAALTRVPRDRIRVIPHGPGWVETRAEIAPADRGARPLRLGYITKLGVQKNFETLFRAVKRLSDWGTNIRLVLTLDPKDSLAARVFGYAEAIGITHLIDNHREVEPHVIADLYDSLDIFVFPSLCESFGIPMVEAMARGLCIVIADTPENREVASAAALTFSALDADELATVLRRLCDDEELRRKHAVMSLRRACDFSWTKAAKGTLAALEAAAARNVS
jgi:glycosyltransferase involved in cell wall biosynthesis